MRNSGHDIRSDIDYIGAFLFEAAADAPPREPREHTRPHPPHVAPSTMVPTENPEDFPPAPPPVSGYREADVQGVACWNCGHFTVCGDPDNDGVPDGICNLWETQAEGEFTCDRFTAHPDLFRQQPHTSWREDSQDAGRDSYDRRFDRGPGVMEADYSDQSSMYEIRFSGEDADENEGLVWKNILRTGIWNSMPTTKGIIKKRLQVIKDGATDIAKGIISLSELKQNFDEQAVPYVTVPLSDDDKDHKNIARLNTGLVKALEIVDGNDGTAFLRAGIDFTEPDVKQKVLRGTIPDVSAGIPFGVTRRGDEKFFSSVLDHVCLTRKPFVDGLGPFGIAAADSDLELPSEAFEMEGEPSVSSSAEAPPPPTETLSFRESEGVIREALQSILIDPASYQIEDVATTYFVIRHKDSKCAWKVKYTMQGKIAQVDPVNSWEMVDEGETEEAEKPPEPVTASDRLNQARHLRELRLSQPNSDSGGIQMSTLNLDGVELSDEARAQIQGIVTENANLRAQNREGEADKRIEELIASIPALKDRPGALKLYRSVFLSDDGGPAVVFSDSQGHETPVTALGLLDQFVDALKGEQDVEFSDQHLASGNDNKPPLTADGERKPLDERVEDSRTALYGKDGKRRTGRK